MGTYTKETESDVRARYIDEDLKKAGWDFKDISLEKAYSYTDAPVDISGEEVTRNKKKIKKVDYLLRYKETNLAIIEAKDSEHTLGAGIQQAMGYARDLDVKFAYSSNGSGFREHDFFTGKETDLGRNEFPSPETLWDRYLKGKGYGKEVEKAISTPYYTDPFSQKRPRYYQKIAIDRTVEAIASGRYPGGIDRRILLVMATGTGKTYTAFQIVHRLREAKLVKNVLYLADRNALIDQSLKNDFAPFKKQGIITKVEKKQNEPQYEIFMSLYQQQKGINGAEDAYKQFDKNFFNLIIVDECHRGSAREDSSWREILDYFSGAIQIGLTATPKVEKEINDNIDYFGDPIYTYSLRQGIEDGYLAPYRIIQIKMDKDLEGVYTKEGQKDSDGKDLPTRYFTSKDFDNTLILPQRREAVAKRITRFLKEELGDRFAKTIVFCREVEYAGELRSLLNNENLDLTADYPDYVMQITGDNPDGVKSLESFQRPESLTPVIVTTSKLLTTGVDVKTCKVLVIDNDIESLTELRQIIGRGTRLYPAGNKYYFTVLDFRNATQKLSDPDFDGDPVIIIDGEKRGKKSHHPRDPPVEEREKKKKYRLGDISVVIEYEKTKVIGSDGRLLNESITSVAKNKILTRFNNPEVFRSFWESNDKHSIIRDLLDEHGEDILSEVRKAVGLYDVDDFDLICHIAFDTKPLTKGDRAAKLRERGYLKNYSGKAREILDLLLDKYATDTSLDLLDWDSAFELDEFHQFGKPRIIAEMFGGKDKMIETLKNMRDYLYSVEAEA